MKDIHDIIDPKLMMENSITIFLKKGFTFNDIEKIFYSILNKKKSSN